MSRDYIDDPNEDMAFSLRRISSTLDDILEFVKRPATTEDTALLHGYTCDLCNWGRDRMRGVGEFAVHLRREHCIPVEAERDSP